MKKQIIFLFIAIMSFGHPSIAANYGGGGKPKTEKRENCKKKHKRFKKMDKAKANAFKQKYNKRG